MSKKRKQNKKTNSTSLFDKFCKSGFFSKISALGLINMVYAVLNYMFETLHQIDCEKFYKIPGYYFPASINYSLMCMGVIVLVVLSSFFLPGFLEKTEGEERTLGNKVELVLYSSMYGLLYGMMNWYIIEGTTNEFSSNDDKKGFLSCLIHENAMVSFLLVLILSMLAVIFWAFLDFKRWNGRNEKDWRKFVAIVFVVVSLIIPAHGIFRRFDSKAENKRKYEFITCDSAEYVVLSEYNGNALVVPYKVVVDGENEKYTFLTNEYRLVPKTDGVFNYKKLTCAPEIE